MQKIIYASVFFIGLAHCNHAEDTWRKYNKNGDNLLTKQEMKQGIMSDMQENRVR